MSDVERIIHEGVIDEKCPANCSHGGECILPAGHEGLHDAKFCQWPDDKTVSKAEADAVLATKPGGLQVLMQEKFWR